MTDGAHKKGNSEFPQLKETRIRLSDGTRLAALVAKQKTARQDLSAIVFCHGFCGDKTENGLFQDAAQVLIRAGYSVVLYDWRGLGHSDGEFDKTTLDWHVRDYVEVIEWSKKYFRIESKALCGLGFSLGAVLIAQAIRSGTDLGAAVFWSPAIRPAVSMWPRYNTPELREQLRANGYILKPETNTKLGHPILDSLRDTDLGKGAFEIGLPLLVCHGTSDSRIPVRDSREAFKLTKKTPVGGVALWPFPL